MQDAGKYIIHSIRSRYDYRKHFLPPLRVSPPPITVQARPNQSTIQLARRRRQEREWGRQDRENDESNRLERSIAKRRWIYRHHLYAKVGLLASVSCMILRESHSTSRPTHTQSIGPIQHLLNFQHRRTLYRARQHFLDVNFRFGREWTSRYASRVLPSRLALIYSSF